MSEDAHTADTAAFGLILSLRNHVLTCISLLMASETALLQVLSEALSWVASAVEDFGVATLDVRRLIDWCVADLGSRDAGVRAAVRSLQTICRVKTACNCINSGRRHHFNQQERDPGLAHPAGRRLRSFLNYRPGHVQLGRMCIRHFASAPSEKTDAFVLLCRRWRCWRVRTGSWVLGWRTWCGVR